MSYTAVPLHPGTYVLALFHPRDVCVCVCLCMYTSVCPWVVGGWDVPSLLPAGAWWLCGCSPFNNDKCDCCRCRCLFAARCDAIRARRRRGRQRRPRLQRTVLSGSSPARKTGEHSTGGSGQQARRDEKRVSNKRFEVIVREGLSFSRSYER